MSAQPMVAVGVAVAAVLTVAAVPYLARLVRSVPDRDADRWWRGQPVGSREVVVAGGVALVLGALCGAAAGWTALLPAFVALALIATPLVLIDLEHHRLPNRLTAPLAAAAAVLLVVAGAAEDAWSHVLGALEGGAAVFAVLFLLNLLSPRSFGFGDVKLGGVMGAYLGWFGWAAVYYGMFAGFLLGAVLAVGLLVTRRATRKTPIPFGPMLVVGPLVVLAFGLVPSFA